MQIKALFRAEPAWIVVVAQTVVGLGLSLGLGVSSLTLTAILTILGALITFLLRDNVASSRKRRGA